MTVTSATEEVEPARHWFYPNHVGKLVLFGLIGGFPFFVYWGYRSWKAYCANWGYSREPFWRDVYAATRYRPSAFWRALLLQGYLLCLFPAVDRECRNRQHDQASYVPFRHPTQLYEMGLAILVLFILLAVDRRFGREGRPRGMITGVLLVALFLGRTLIEFWKEPQLGETLGFLNRGQLLSLPFILAGMGLVAASIRRPQPAGWVVRTGTFGPLDGDEA